jgi:hypothetical protein
MILIKHRLAADATFMREAETVRQQVESATVSE